MTWLLWVAGLCVGGAFAAIIASKAVKVSNRPPRRRLPLVRPA
jgi:hypothetical protein